MKPTLAAITLLAFACAPAPRPLAVSGRSMYRKPKVVDMARISQHEAPPTTVPRSSEGRVMVTTNHVAASRRHPSPGVEQWRSLVAQYPWPVDQALRVMECESGGNPNARNQQGSSAYGLFQVMDSYHAWRYEAMGFTHDPFNPEANIAAAYHLWAEQGWRPWVCRP